MSLKRTQRPSNGPSFEGLEARRLLSGWGFSIEIGTSGNDEITGTDGRDIIVGRSGDDTLIGLAGNDMLIGGSGADVIDGGAGKDKIIAGSGDDLVDGGEGKDKIIAGSGNDTITAGAGSDWVVAGSGDDVIRHSVLTNRDGNAVDRYIGGGGQDTLVVDLVGLSAAEAEDIQTRVTNAFGRMKKRGRCYFGRLDIDGLNVRMVGIEQVEFVLPPSDTEPPVVEDDILSVFEGGEITFPSPGVLVNDVDPEGQPLFVSAVNGVEADVGQVITLASGATLQMDADGQFVYDTNSAFDDLNIGETGQDTFTYTAADGEGGFATATVTIWIFGA